jgi:hypothetical protein
MPADRAELPFLEAIHIREGLTGRAPDDEVHDKEVMRVILIKIYRLFVITGPGEFLSRCIVYARIDEEGRDPVCSFCGTIGKRHNTVPGYLSEDLQGQLQRTGTIRWQSFRRKSNILT